MSKLLKRRQLLTAKIESTYNTDPTPVPADNAILVEELTWSNEGLKMIERPAVRPSLGALQQIYGGRLVALAFGVEVKGSGTNDVPPEIGVLLRACGLGETIAGATSVTYEPVSTALESITCYVYEDGKQIKVTGVRGNVAFTLEAGNKVMANFTLTGHVAAQTDVALPAPTFDSTVPVAYIGGAFVIDGFSGVISALSFDLSNNLAMPASVNGTDGFDEISIVSRDINGSIDPLDELVATEDYIGNFTSGKLMALATGAIGADAGNIINITMPAVYYREAAPSDRDGIAALAMPFGATESTTDDEVSIVFT